MALFSERANAEYYSSIRSLPYSSLRNGKQLRPSIGRGGGFSTCVRYSRLQNLKIGPSVLIFNNVFNEQARKNQTDFDNQNYILGGFTFSSISTLGRALNVPGGRSAFSGADL
jgi:hypothetical protein